MRPKEKLAYYEGRGVTAWEARRYLDILGTPRSILDLGCGTGDFGRYKPTSTVVHGVDIDPRAVERASSYEISVCADLDNEALPFQDGSFDAVLARDIFEHVEDPGRLAKEAYRVLRPEGLILASMVMARPKRVWADYTHRRGFTKQSAQLLLRDAGFEVIGTKPMGGIPLTRRFGLLWTVPVAIQLPIVNQLFASSWEVLARQPGPG